MKPIIICSSRHHQNTYQIAKAIAKPLKAQLVRTKKANPEKINSSPLTGFGSGIYFGQPDPDLLKLTAKLSPKPGQAAFIFSTRGMPFWGKIFHRRLREGLKNQGFKIIGEFSCRGWDTYGPFKLVGGLAKNRPNQKDRLKARQFGLKLKEKLTENQTF